MSVSEPEDDSFALQESHSEVDESFSMEYDAQLDPLDNESEDSSQDLVAKFLDGQCNLDYVQETFKDRLDLSGVKEEPADGVVSVKPQTVRKYKKSMKLPPALKCLMGEANLRCARGDKQTAVKICLEIIRQVPSAPEPFQTLAGIYEEMGDRENALLMSLIAAHLTPTDLYSWLHLANQSEELGKIRQAISCYTKAIKLDLTNMDLHKKRTELLEKIGDKKTAVKGYLRMLYSLDSSQGEYVVSVAKFVAEMCHKENDLEKACSVLELAVTKCPKLIKFDFVNLHLELLIVLKNYKRCLEILVEFCDMVFEAESIVDHETNVETFNVIDCYFLDTTPVDILSKLAVILIHMHSYHLIERVTAPILELLTSDVGELYLDIAEAYVEENKHEEACMLYCQLVNSDIYSLPGVWLKYAESLKTLGRLEEAVDAYYNVLEGAQQHTNVKLTLASILVELGRQEEAVNVLYQHEDETIDAGLLYERCKLLKDDPAKLNDLITVSQCLFLRHSMKINSKEELKTISTLIKPDRKRTHLKQLRESRSDLIVPEIQPEFCKKGSNDPNPEDEWTLFLEVCNICYQKRMYGHLHSFAVLAQLSNLFNPKYKHLIEYLSTIAAFFNKDYFSAYNIVRSLVIKSNDSVQLWQLFNMIINRSDDARHNRFIMRLLARNTHSYHLGILHGNNCLVSGTYKYALYEYGICQKQTPTPLCSLLLGITYLQMAAQKFISMKHCVVTQAIGFLSEYKEKRGSSGTQEAYYNLGRAFHHLGILETAAHFYKLALNYPPELSSFDPAIFDMKREAAYNLHLIYLHSESYDLARMYIDKYIIV